MERAIFKLIYPNDEQNVRLRNWFAERMGGAPELYQQLLAIMRDEELVGAVAFFSYRHPSIEMGLFCVDPAWSLHRRLIVEVMTYPFDQLGCERITALVSDKNTRLQRLLEIIGFEREGTVRRGAEDGSDIGLYGILKRDWLCLSQREPNTSGTMRQAITS